MKYNRIAAAVAGFIAGRYIRQQVERNRSLAYNERKFLAKFDHRP